MTNPIRNETSLVLVVAVIFSAIAIPVLSGFLDPSQPPAVAAVQIGDPRDDDADARDDNPPARSRESAPGGEAKRQRSAQSQSRARELPKQPAPSAPVDDAAEDDGGEAD